VKEEGRSGTHSEESEVDAIKGEIEDVVDSEIEDRVGSDELQDAESQHEARKPEDMISSRHFVCMYPMFTRW
jgi:hypothetical protein